MELSNFEKEIKIDKLPSPENFSLETGHNLVANLPQEENLEAQKDLELLMSEL